jgi:hypothetical protein
MSPNPSAMSYGEWNPAGAAFRIRYSQSLMQQIDFCAGEGYRRIAHGGLEVGGLLYGPVEGGVLTLLAYQPIECQHSKGPSFVLSESDVQRLREQIRKPFREAETDLPLAGWFISHCRSELAMTQQEIDLFAQLFPSPHCVTLLAKPERLKPTQYGFLARSKKGTLPDTRCRETFLLPLALRPEAAGTAEIVAPPPRPSSRRAPRGLPSEQAPPAARETALASPRVGEPGKLTTAAPTAEPASPPASPVVTPPTAAVSAMPPPVAPEPRKPREDRAADVLAPAAGRSQAAESREPVKVETGIEAERLEIEEIEPPTFGVKRAEARGPGLPLALKAGLAALLVIVLLLAVVWTYMNFLLKPIRLTAETRDGKLVVSWPAESTSGANESWLGTFVEGRPSSRPLTPQEQERGETTLERAGEDVTVELRVRNWFYERQGMIRWIRVPPAPSVPPAAARAARR